MKHHLYIRLFLLTGIFFCATALQAQNTQKNDSLEQRLQTPNLSNDETCQIYKNLLLEYVHTDIDKSMEYAWKGISFAKKTNNDYYLAVLYYNTGSLYISYVLQLDSALYYFERSLAMKNQEEKKGTKHKEELEILQINISIGFAMINFYTGNYDLALNDFFSALSIAEKLNKSEKMAELYLNIAEIYAYLMNLTQAELYYLKAEEMFRKLNDSANLAETYVRISYIYISQKDYPKALEYAEEAYRIMSLLPDTPFYSLINATLKLAEISRVMDDYDKALEYALISVEYAEKNKNSERTSAALMEVSQCYYKLQKYKESEEMAFRALEMDSSSLYSNSVKYRVIAMSNIRMKNVEKSLEYFQKTLDTREQYSNRNYQSSISEMEVQYETEKKEMKIAALEEEKQLMRLLFIAGGGILLLALALMLFLWRWTVQKRRLAEAHIKQFEQEKQLIATQAVFDGEVQERTRLARDLHDGMGGKLTVMKIYLEKLKQISHSEDGRAEALALALATLDDSVQELRRVSHNLMPDTPSHSGLKTAVDDFCRTMSPNIVFNYYGDEARLDLKIEAMIYRSIYELVNNALKYANSSKIMVQIIREPDTVAFTVQDNGCGFDASAHTEGMGLQSIRSRVESFGGNLQIDSKAGEGTEVNVELRLSEL